MIVSWPSALRLAQAISGSPWGLPIGDLRAKPALGRHTMRAVGILLCLLVANSAFAQSVNEDIPVGRFSQGSLSDWDSRSFKGETTYELVEDTDLRSMVLAAATNGAASGRYRKIKIDLTKTPFLNWSWKVTKIFPGIDENEKSGDDFPARIYVVVERGLLGTRSLVSLGS
jgi:hypothetical protein